MTDHLQWQCWYKIYRPVLRTKLGAEKKKKEQGDSMSCVLEKLLVTQYVAFLSWECRWVPSYYFYKSYATKTFSFANSQLEGEGGAGKASVIFFCWMLYWNYTGSRFQRVRFLRAPRFCSEKNTNWHQCLMSSNTMVLLKISTFLWIKLLVASWTQCI